MFFSIILLILLWSGFVRLLQVQSEQVLRS